MSKVNSKSTSDRTLALILVALGALLLLGQLFDMGTLILPVLAIGFGAAGIAQREAGWFIPAGILAGISLGTGLSNSTLVGSDDGSRGGTFMFAFALGWTLIPLLSRLFTHERNDWAFIPAGIMALVGLAAIGVTPVRVVLNSLNVLWPLALIAVGGYLLYQQWAPEKEDARLDEE